MTAHSPGSPSSRRDEPHYGWRARIGLIVPSLNVTMEPEFQAAIPDGVSVHATRVFLEQATPANLEKLAGWAGEAGRLLASADVNVIVFGCTSGSLVGGLGWDESITGMIEEASSTRATTTSTAVVAALHALGAERIALGTPYIAEVNELEERFLEDHGFEVVSREGLGFTTGAELHNSPAGTAYALGRRIDRTEADCLFLSCTDLRTMSEIRWLEDDVGKPVVTSNGASLWHALRIAGVLERVHQFGATVERLTMVPPAGGDPSHTCLVRKEQGGVGDC